MLRFEFCSVGIARIVRYLSLLTFPAIAAVLLANGMGVEPVVMYAIACGMYLVLLRRLGKLGPETAAVWLVLAIFLVFYFLRYPIIAFDPAPVIATHPGSISDSFRDGGLGLNRALSMSVLAFSIFCAVTTMLLSHESPLHVNAQPASDGRDERVIKFLLFFVPLLMLALGGLAYIYRIGQMGAPPGEPLPFRLKGVIFYGRLVLLPLMILAIIQLGNRLERREYIWIGFALLAMHGASDMFIRVSRSSVLQCVLLLAFLSVSGGLRLKRSIVLTGLGLAAWGIYMMPILMQSRLILISEPNIGPMQAFLNAFWSAQSAALDTFLKGLSTVYFRIPGIETTWAIDNTGVEPLGLNALSVVRGPSGIAGYLTHTLYRIEPNYFTLFAPGFVGWLYLVGGHIGVGIGAAILAWVCVSIPSRLNGANTGNGPLFNTFLLWMLFLCLTDGTIDGNVLLLTSGVVALAAWNCIFPLIRDGNLRWQV